ncbi:MAG: hypothetical protein JEZ12_24660 [Desulfobacterium sp.]|nr:hypothetical protein [Desulfobacterium sp.]
MNIPKHFPENKTAGPQGTGSETSTDTPPDASTVTLSGAGRVASVTVDFNATTDNLLKLDALGNSKSFAKAHGVISYEKVKNLLE